MITVKDGNAVRQVTTAVTDTAVTAVATGISAVTRVIMAAGETSAEAVADNPVMVTNVILTTKKGVDMKIKNVLLLMALIMMPMASIAQDKLFSLEDLNFGGTNYRNMVPENK